MNYGDESYKRIASSLGRRQVALHFGHCLSQIDHAAFTLHLTDEFVSVWLDSIIVPPRKWTVQASFTEEVFRLVCLRDNAMNLDEEYDASPAAKNRRQISSLFIDLPVGRKPGSDQIQVAKEELVSVRLGLLDGALSCKDWNES